ncbi:unnamed protein product, partial [Brenthis ino]
MTPKQTREEILEKKTTVTERQRLEKNKSDPVLRANQQEKERQKYLTKKSKGIILPIDLPSAQYRNRKMFYVMAKLHWDYKSLQRVVWNYSEKGHGKGAPDSVGEVLKIAADRIVAVGNDFPLISLLVTFKFKYPRV